MKFWHENNHHIVTQVPHFFSAFKCLLDTMQVKKNTLEMSGGYL